MKAKRVLFKHFYHCGLSQYNSRLFALNQRAQMSDPNGELLKDVATRKDKVAFKNLYQNYQPKIYHYLMKTGLSSEQSLELSQDVMLKVWKSANQYDPQKGNANTWIFTIVRNCRFDYYRKISSDPLNISSSDIYLDELPGQLEDELENLYQQIETKRVISTLSDEQQHVLNSIYGLGMTHSEFAQKESIPLGTVKSRLRLAMGQLKTKLED